MRTRRVVLIIGSLIAMVGCGRGQPTADPTTNGTPSGLVTTPAPASSTLTSPSRSTTSPPATSHPATSHPATQPTTPKPTTATSSPAPPFPRTLLGKDLERIPTSRKIIALTFDAGSTNAGVSSILSTLASQHVPATFFLTGNFVSTFPSDARRIADGGYRLGNHSVTHPHFTDLTDAQIRAQLSGAAATIRATTGRSPAPFFRFPYGDRDTRTIATVNAAGYLPIRWTVDSLGWQGTMSGTRSAAFVRDRVLAAATPGGIVLMHVGANPDDHSTLDADALPGIISGLRAMGYEFVTLDVLLT
jgi:peptidoglycan/xylan/chitin deacetylase (PgdA/CDA1 family)